MTVSISFQFERALSVLAFVDRATVRRQGGLSGVEIHIDGLAETFTDVLVRIEHQGGVTQVARLTSRSPSFVVSPLPNRAQIARAYTSLGVKHILLGIDHLLFVLGLLLIVRGRLLLVKTITAFTVAHSVTLGASVLGFVHVPQSPVEAVIALSIVFLAGELLRRRVGRVGLTEQYPWLVAFVFGCLHGFGFAGALAEIGLPQSDIPLALLTFNVGVEIGQLVFLFACLLVIAAGRRVLGAHLTWAPSAAAYAIGGVSAYWLIERVIGFW